MIDRDRQGTRRRTTHRMAERNNCTQRRTRYSYELANEASIRWPSFSNISSMADSRCHSRRVRGSGEAGVAVYMRDGGGAGRGGDYRGGGVRSHACLVRGGTKSIYLSIYLSRLIQRGDEELGVVPYVARLRQARILLRDGIGDALRDAHLG